MGILDNSSRTGFVRCLFSGLVWWAPGEWSSSDRIVQSVKFDGGGLWCGLVFQELGLDG